MMRVNLALLCFAVFAVTPAAGQQERFAKDVIPTSGGDLEITFIGHGTLMLVYEGKIIHIDPYGKLADYGKLPKADMILLTHHHGDHLDPAALGMISTPRTTVVLTEKCFQVLGYGSVMQNSDVMTALGSIKIEAVPAYNILHRRDNGQLFHPRGEGNGYIMTFGDTRVYIAGDTEDIPEMKKLKDIDYAFLPMNLPYTMTPEMVARAAAAFKPKVLYPYHYGETDPGRVILLLNNHPEIQIRIRSMR